MINIKKLALLSALYFSLYAEDKFFVFIIASYNNEAIVKKNILSILKQNYHNYHIIYCDDASTDLTETYVQDTCLKHNATNKRTYVKNKHNSKALFSIYNSIHLYCKDTDIVILLDGDDWLTDDPTILDQLNTIYQDPNIWTTYGEFISLSSPDGTHGTAPYSEYNIEESTFRYTYFYFTHLRTFYAGLFKKIKITDFLHNNNFFYYAWDLPIAFPLLEMAKNHIYYNEVPFYVYNNILTTNDHALNQRKQMYFDFLTRNKEQYKPLEKLTSFNISDYTIGHLTSVNHYTEESFFSEQMSNVNAKFDIKATILCLTNANHHLVNADILNNTSISIVPNCYYHSWISSEVATNIRLTLQEKVENTPADYFIITSTGELLPSFDLFNVEMLTCSDVIIIGNHTEYAVKNFLHRKYPHAFFISLNYLGEYLDFKCPSAIIITKQKLLASLQACSWTNGSYLSFIALISLALGTEYCMFLANNNNFQ